MFIAGCYIPHRESPFYEAFHMDKNHPFEDLYEDIHTYAQKGCVMLIGDMNARIANAQMQAIDLMTLPGAEHTTDVLDNMWQRGSKDQVTNPQGSAMISMLTSMQMIALNGVEKFSKSGDITCYTANQGTSVIDYVLIQHEAIHMVKNFEVGSRSPNSDHTPIHVWLQIHIGEAKKQQCNKSWSYKLQAEKRKIYATSLDAKLMYECIPDQITHTWQKFKQAMEDTATETMGKAYTTRTNVKGLPHNPWFDEECKLAKRQLRATPTTAIEWASLAKNYTALKRRKRREHELRTESHALMNFKKNPKKEWMRMKDKRKDITGNISPEDMHVYVEKLYVHENAREMPDIEEVAQSREYFDSSMVTKSLKKLANGKAPDMLHFKSEMLKWSGGIARQWIHTLINQAITQGLPMDWQQNWIKALFKKGDANQPTNYRTIMIGSCMAKLLGSVTEQALSLWAETNNKRAKGQAGFRPKHSTIDHLISIRVLMEESRLKGQALYCCFVDFTKAFDTIPRAGLWKRMEHIGVPPHL